MKTLYLVLVAALTSLFIFATPQEQANSTTLLPAPVQTIIKEVPVPGPVRTIIERVEVPVPGPTVTIPGPTVTVPGPVRTVIVPGPTVTVTEPGLTVPGPTATVTVTPTPIPTPPVVRPMDRDGERVTPSEAKERTKTIRVGIPQAIGVAAIVGLMLIALIGIFLAYYRGYKDSDEQEKRLLASLRDDILGR